MIDIKTNNEIEIDGYSVKDLAKEFGTPVYVYSKKQLLDNIDRLKSAVDKFFPDNRIQYAVKANTNPHILKIIQESGLGADCSSPVEALISKKINFPKERSTYTGNFESMDDFKVAIESGFILNLDDYHRLDDVLEVGRPEVLSFRINPGIGRGGFEGIVTGGNDAKFGIPYEEVKTAYKAAIDRGFTRFGIHMMTGSNILEPFYFAEITQKLLYIIEEHLLDLGIKFEFINIGGGLGIPYTDQEQPLDVEQTFKLVGDVFHQKVKDLGIGNPALMIEPGRFIVGNIGCLISEVTHIKNSYRNYLGIDAGMSTLIRPALYKAYHQIHINGRDENGEVPYRICGPICENSDIHPVDRYFNNPQKGDLAVIRNAGGYSFVMSSNYNNRPRPAEVLIDENGPRLIRKADSPEQVFNNVVDFSLS